MKLDELARSSADAARASVRSLEPPSIRDGRSARGWTPVLAGATVSALVVGGLVLMNRDADGTEPVAAPPTAPPEVDVPRLGLPPDDTWAPVFATDGSDVPDIGTQRFDYYGDPTAEHPFADDELVIGWGDLTDELTGDPVEVRGVTGASSPGDAIGVGADVRTLMWTEPDGTSVLLASRHADAARLVEIADGLTIEPVVGTITPDPALGLVRVASGTGTPFMAMRGDGDGSMVAYRSVDVDDLSVVVTTRRGALDEFVRSTEWWLGSPTEIVLTAGVGYEFDFSELFGGQGGTGRLLVWEPAPGVTAQIILSGPDTGVDLTALADSMVEIDDATWSALLQAEPAPDPDTGSLDVVYGEGRGEIEGAAYAWSFGEQDGQLCFNFSTGDGGSASCQQVPTTIGSEPAIIVDQGTTDRFASWLIAAEPSVDDVIDLEGGVIAERFEAGSFSWFVAVVPAGRQPSFAVRVDGTVVATVQTGITAEEPVSDSGPAPGGSAPGGG